jgi:ribosome biogenesis protein BMS1
MSDIVFLRTWYPVQPKKLFNPVTSLLLPMNHTWEGMKTVYQLRKERQMKIPVNKDSQYSEIERTDRKFNPLRIPRSLQAKLPFASVPKDQKKRKTPTLASRHARVLEPEEKQRLAVLNQLRTFKNEKVTAKKVKTKQKLEDYKKKKQKEQEEADARKRLSRKRLFRMEGIMKEKQARKKQRTS